MRIHGKNEISRSVDVNQENDYKKYVPQLREDFKHICGYCGKSEEVTTKGFEPDHFVPGRIDSNRKLDYSNLVYSCFTCNRKKLGKWPTEDKNKSNDGNIGFVDPALKEYDLHLGRDKEGNIEFYTKVGEYMYNIAFSFDMRPMKEIWKISQLINAKDNLFKVKDKLTPEELMKYLELDKAIDELKKILFEKKE
ncbi:HNH endonuclease [Lachnoanaerobaculum gingivalis]|uniref:HNH endonuclease n=1 Tax=Lachnoanaerobaculum gingivalis TaxID=2490855 RepID=A0A3P3QX36_9FIRM|nr:HNH endonuclease signature motif containing protein [Lachnoanaerobaculum gingivalis]RRJ25278.1 HNH endonuclease [Lachnoanaerobaculum gingivalis]